MTIKCWMRLGLTSLAAITGTIGCSSARNPADSLLSTHRSNRAAPGTTCGGWSFQNRLPTSNTLNAVTAPVPGSLVAVGANGTIVRSDDGGENWMQQCTGTTDNLIDVSFVNAQTGWAVGGYQDGSGRTRQTILHTSDGETWTPQSSGSNSYLS